MAMILDAFMSDFSRILMEMILDETGMLLGIPGEIEKLQQTIGDIRCILADAEKKQIESETVKRWLIELKDVMYDADDIMDLCQIKIQERRARFINSPSSLKLCHGGLHLDLLSCFRNPAFAHDIGSKIKRINSRLEEISKKKDDLGLIKLQNTIGFPPHVYRVNTIVDLIKTNPVLVQEDLVGEKIEVDAKLVVSWLTEEEKGARDQKISVVAIVGMGGIGKTTLAKRIFNDPRIHSDFELKIWTCVSRQKEFDVLKCIIREIGGEYGAAQERSELVPLLKRLVQRKKFLLVLDDVWPESQVIWDGLLRAPLMAAADGSRLLITTRDESVANRMRATKLHRVKKLSDQDGWSLLIKQVFQSEEESEIQNFKNIGLQLVKKCDGLPLAIKSIGGVLCTKSKTIQAWQAVVSNDMWSMKELTTNFHQAFYLSFEDLPLPLKQCFIICSLYPEDYIYHQSDLVFLWSAEGFLQDHRNMWELGTEYYRELLRRNLLEDSGDQYDQSMSKMHDLLWSFARYIGKDENLILREGDDMPKREYSSKLRRMSIIGNEMSTKILKKEKWLRTLFMDGISETILANLCKTLSKLRTLDLRGSCISNLPDSLCALKHLRYLDVSESEIKIIPESIGYLRNLVYLDFYQCTKLSQIPQSIINLEQLRHLGLMKTKVETIPVGLKNLKELIHLNGFKPDKNKLKGFSSIDELEDLSQLVTLRVCALERVTEMSIVKRAKLWSKKKLHRLILEYTSLSWEDQMLQADEKKATIEDILNELCPPLSLEFLQIVGYFGSCLPDWLNMGAAFSNMRFLDIRNCNCIKKFSSLGQLPNLDILQIEEAYSVVSVGGEFFGTYVQSRDLLTMSSSIISPFPKLNKLEFSGMPNWKKWQWNKEESAMPKLKKLIIKSCPKLRSLPDGLLQHATSLEYLEINRANNLSTIENLPSIKDIRICENPNLKKVSNIPSISHILIEGCPNLKIVDNLNKSLQSMQLVDFEMEVLPEYVMTTTPRKLRIDCNEELLRKIASQGKGGSEWHKFKHIPKVQFYSWDGSLYASYQKTPLSFTSDNN